MHSFEFKCREVVRIFILFVLPLTSFSQLEGKVVSIADGDTFTMLVNEVQIKVRLHGIDCPEKAQDFGNVAKEFLADLVFLKNGCNLLKYFPSPFLSSLFLNSSMFTLMSL